MAGLAALLGALLFALVNRGRISAPAEDEPLGMHLWSLAVVTSLVAGILAAMSAAIEGREALHVWEMVAVCWGVTWGLLALIGREVVAHVRVVGAILERHVPVRLRPIASILWSWSTVLVALLLLGVQVT